MGRFICYHLIEKKRRTIFVGYGFFLLKLTKTKKESIEKRGSDFLRISDENFYFFNFQSIVLSYGIIQKKLLGGVVLRKNYFERSNMNK